MFVLLSPEGALGLNLQQTIKPCVEVETTGIKMLSRKTSDQFISYFCLFRNSPFYALYLCLMNTHVFFQPKQQI